MFKKLIGLVTASLMAIVGLVAMPIAMAPAQAAPPASAFDPGLIISDSVFFDFRFHDGDRHSEIFGFKSIRLQIHRPGD